MLRPYMIRVSTLARPGSPVVSRRAAVAVTDQKVDLSVLQTRGWTLDLNHAAVQAIQIWSATASVRMSSGAPS
jgi:hypothetical protein